MISEKINKSKEKPKKETFIQAVVTLIFSQVLIKLLGLLQKILLAIMQLVSFLLLVFEAKILLLLQLQRTMLNYQLIQLQQMLHMLF